jgi:hypothetical protein
LSMAVLQFREIWNGRVGSVDDANIRQYRRVFRVQTDSMLDGPEDVIATIGLPKRYAPYIQPNGTVDRGSRAIKANAKIDQDDPFTWIVEFDYSTIRLGPRSRHTTELEKPKMADAQGDKTSPLDRPTVIRYATLKGTRVADEDANLVAITNTAGQNITGLTVDESTVQVTMVRNEAFANFPLYVQYRDAVNSDPFFGAVPLTGKVESISADEQFEGADPNNPGFLYWTITYVFHFVSLVPWRPNGWRKHVLMQGYMERDPNDATRLRNVYDSRGRPISGPVLLDANGRYQPDPTKAIWQDFQVYPELPFSVFNLP